MIQSQFHKVTLVTGFVFQGHKSSAAAVVQ